VEDASTPVERSEGAVRGGVRRSVRGQSLINLAQHTKVLTVSLTHRVLPGLEGFIPSAEIPRRFTVLLFPPNHADPSAFSLHRFDFELIDQTLCARETQS
jgi:hypothetical protein